MGKLDKSTFLHGKAKKKLKEVPTESVQTAVTSPPYWGLRDYDASGQIGLEDTPEKYVENLVEVFRELKSALKENGTFWLNIGDSYTDKNLAGVPWRLAFALQDDGWNLRNNIIWKKTNPMPESVGDRLTTSHENIFLLTKSKNYKFNQDAIREPHETDPNFETEGKRGHTTKSGKKWADQHDQRHGSNINYSKKGKNKRDVWEMSVASFDDAHFAVFPEELPKNCILAGSDEGDVVLDPFSGAGTTGAVALKNGRKFVGVELNEKFIDISKDRIKDDEEVPTNHSFW